MEILRALVPKNNSKFSIPMITIQQTVAIIDKIPNTTAVGHDDINNRFIRKIKHVIAPHITHLINSIILTKIYPHIYKITRVLPQSKPSTDTNFIENYRPLSILCSVEKIIEQYFLSHLESFFTDNKLFNNSLHGGRKDHSTLTAITEIYHNLYKNKEENLTSIILVTD